jgi:hypothetical protein
VTLFDSNPSFQSYEMPIVAQYVNCHAILSGYDMSLRWYATYDSNMSNFKQRALLLTPPKYVSCAVGHLSFLSNSSQVFAPLLEGRGLVIENLPHPEEGSAYLVTSLIYDLSYKFDTESFDLRTTGRSDGGLVSGYFASMVFRTSEQAALAKAKIEGQIHRPSGRVLQASCPKPPMRILGGFSWDGGRPGPHNTARGRKCLTRIAPRVHTDMYAVIGQKAARRAQTMRS